MQERLDAPTVTVSDIGMTTCDVEVGFDDRTGTLRVQIRRVDNNAVVGLNFNGSPGSTNPRTWNVTGLDPGVAYFVQVRSFGTGFQSSDLVRVDFTTLDPPPPPLSDPVISITGITSSAARVLITLDDRTEIITVLVESTETPPTVVHSFFGPYTESTYTVDLSGLAPEVEYSVGCIVSAAGIDDSNAVTAEFTTDPAPPGQLERPDADFSDETHNSVRLELTFEENAETYSLRVRDVSETHPAVFDRTGINIGTNRTVIRTVTGLMASTRYQVDVSCDADGFLESPVRTITFLSGAAPPPDPDPDPNTVSWTFTAVVPSPRAVDWTFRATPVRFRTVSFLFTATFSVRAVLFEFSAVQPNRVVDWDFQATLANMPRPASWTFRADPSPQARAVSYDFSASEGAPNAVTWDFMVELEDEEPPVMVPGNDWDLIVADRSSRTIYRVNRLNPSERGGPRGFGPIGSIGADRNFSPTSLAVRGNFVYVFGDSEIWRYDLTNNTSRRVGTGFPNRFGAGFTSGGQLIVAIDSPGQIQIRRQNFNSAGNTVSSTFLGTLPDGLIPAGLAVHPVSGNYYVTDAFDQELWRINPADIDSESGSYGLVGEITGMSFPAAFAIYPIPSGTTYVGYASQPNQRDIYRVSLGNAQAVRIGTIYSGVNPLGMDFARSLPTMRLGTPTITIMDIEEFTAVIVISPVQFASGYRVTVTQVSPRREIYNTSGATRQRLITGLENDTRYRVTVFAIGNVNYENSNSVSLTFTTKRSVSWDFQSGLPRPFWRDGFTLSASFTFDRAILSWNPADFAQRYRILISNFTGPPFQSDRTIEDTNIEVTGLFRGEEYSYTILAINGSGTGVQSGFFDTPDKTIEWEFQSIMAVSRPVLFEFYGVPQARRQVTFDFIAVFPLQVPTEWAFVSIPRLVEPVSWLFSTPATRPVEFAFNAPIRVDPVSWTFVGYVGEPRQVTFEFVSIPMDPEMVSWDFRAVFGREVSWDFSVPAREVSWEFMALESAPRRVDYRFSAYANIMLPAPLIPNLVPSQTTAVYVPVIESRTTAHIHLGEGNPLAAEPDGDSRHIYLAHSDGRYGASGSYSSPTEAVRRRALWRVYPFDDPVIQDTTEISIEGIGTVLEYTTNGEYRFSNFSSIIIAIYEFDELEYFELEAAAPSTFRFRAYDFEGNRILRENEPDNGFPVSMARAIAAGDEYIRLTTRLHVQSSQVGRVEWWATVNVAWPDLVYYIGPWGSRPGRALPGPVLHPYGETELLISSMRDNALSQSPPTIPTMEAYIFDEHDYLFRYLHSDRWPLHLTMARCWVIFENSGVYSGEFAGILNMPRYTNEDTHKFVHLSGIGMSTLLTQNARINHPRLFGPGDDMTVGKIIMEATSHYCSVHGLDISEILADAEPTLLADFPMPVAFWWMSNENLWTVFARAVATQGPPATFYEHFGRIYFWSGRRARPTGLNIGGPPEGGMGWEPGIRGNIIMTDHVADIANDAIIPVQAKGYLTPLNLVYTTGANPRPHVPEWVAHNLRTEELIDGLAQHRHEMGGAVVPSSYIPVATPNPVPRPDTPHREIDVGLQQSSVTSYTTEQWLNGEDLEPVVLWTNLQENLLYQLAGQPRQIPARDSLRYLYSHSEPFKNAIVEIDTTGYIDSFEAPPGTPVNFSTQTVRLSATDLEIIITNDSAALVPAPRVILRGTPLVSQGVANYLTSVDVRNDARTIASRNLYRYRQYEYQGYTSIYPVQADQLADWAVEFYREGVKTMDLTLYVEGLRDRFRTFARMRQLIPLAVFHPDYFADHGRFNMLIRSIVHRIRGRDHFIQVTLDENPELRSVNPVGRSPLLP